MCEPGPSLKRPEAKRRGRKGAVAIKRVVVFVVVMRSYFGSTDWRVNLTVLLIILFFTAPLFLVAYQLGVYVRDHHYVPRITERALKKERNREERMLPSGRRAMPIPGKRYRQPWWHQGNRSPVLTVAARAPRAATPPRRRAA